MENSPIKRMGRDSGIELFRIITMLVIVAHHYVVNSGLTTVINESTHLSSNVIFYLLFGWGGKTGINCFVLITGYFMCTSQVTVKKFLKLVLWVEFYRIIFWLIFTLTGYQKVTVDTIFKAFCPVTSVGNGFTSAYLLFYLFIPFLNILIKAMSKKQHILLIGLCLGVYTILATMGINVVFNYVTWFSVIYIIGAYLRLYPEKWFDSRKLWGWSSVATLLISWTSVIVMAYAGVFMRGKVSAYYYFFVSDSNKLLAVVTAICAFMFFKNLHIGYNKIINKIAASAFGVLLIHANSDAMRKWLWQDILKNTEQYNSNTFIIHAIGSVIAIYIICTAIDWIRIRFIEKPLFKIIDKKMLKEDCK